MWNPYVIIEWLVEARWLSDDILILEPHRPNIMNKCPGIEGPFIFINLISQMIPYTYPEISLILNIFVATDFWHVQQRHIQIYTVPPFTCSFGVSFLGWGPGGIEEAEGQTLISLLRSPAANRILVERKVLEKGVSFDIFVGRTWCTWQPAIESRKMYEDDKMHD